jgi:TolB-like protein
MKRHLPVMMVLVVVWAGAFAGLLPAPPASAQTEASVADKLAEVLRAYNELDFDKGLTITDELLKRPDLVARDSLAIYAVKSMLAFAKGEEYFKQSFGYLDKMAEIGPCTIQLPYEFWPKQLRDRWYKVAQAKNALVCNEQPQKIQTIAIMEFDNYSVGKYQEALGYIAKGLADFFETDFSQISDLKVVERDKVDYILKEIELGESGKVSEATAVKAGKLLGAQLMVFGSIVQTDDKTARMLVKVVKVETSEVLASVDKQGKPDYFQMEKELVKELATKLNLTLSETTVKLLDESGTASADAATLYSQGLYYMDQYDYKKAYEYFKLAYEKDNTFAEAKKKMDIYRPLAS